MTIDTSQLAGKHVYLELLTPDHREIIRPIARDERIWEFNKMLLVDERFDRMYDDYLDTAMNKEAMGGQYSFVIRSTRDQAIIGMTRLYEINQKDKSATIGYTWYIPSVWGKVHNKECKLLLLQFIFEELKYMRAELRVAHQNIRSQKAMEKIGGVKVNMIAKDTGGIVKHHLVFEIKKSDYFLGAT